MHHKSIYNRRQEEAKNTCNRCIQRLHRAVLKNNVEKVKFLLNVLKVAVDPAALMIACQLDNLQMVQFLICNQSSPADPNALDDEIGVSSFYYAVRKNNLKLVKLLLREAAIKVDIDCKYLVKGPSVPEIWNTPLYCAMRNNDIPLFKLLLRAGADVNVNLTQLRSDEAMQFTPLMMAVDLENMECCKLLVKYGTTKVNLNYAVEFAASYDKLNFVKYFTEECGVDILTPDVLVEILGNDSAKTLEFCLQHCVGLFGDRIWWMKDPFSPTVLLKAICSSAFNCIEVLLRWGSLTNYNPDFPELDPLHGAAHYGDIRSMKLVVEYQPQFLQAEWFLNEKIPHALTDTEEGAEFVDTLQKIRKNPIRLDLMCRVTIIQQLGSNPFPKVQKLKLPRILRDFLQFKHVENVRAV